MFLKILAFETTEMSYLSNQNGTQPKKDHLLGQTKNEERTTKVRAVIPR
jgi:hypothetical protein